MHKKKYTISRDTKLGFNLAEGRAKLRKQVIFHLMKLAGLDNCFKCGNPLSPEDFTIEHKVSFFGTENPEELFYDINNIAFSHFKCNVKAKDTIPTYEKPEAKHGTMYVYNQGCRCEACKIARRMFARESRKRLHNKT